MMPVGSVVARPSLWMEAARLGWSHRRRRWWGRAPFLPVPSAEHLAWRRLTAYGDSGHPVEPADLVAYVEWRRRQRRAVR